MDYTDDLIDENWVLALLGPDTDGNHMYGMLWESGWRSVAFRPCHQRVDMATDCDMLIPHDMTGLDTTIVVNAMSTLVFKSEIVEVISLIPRSFLSTVKYGPDGPRTTDDPRYDFYFKQSEKMIKVGANASWCLHRDCKDPNANHRALGKCD